MTDLQLQHRYNAAMDSIAEQVSSVHGYLTAADIETRDELASKMIKRGLITRDEIYAQGGYWPGDDK